ncbi:putative esterase C31F10.02 [Yarrowia sp. C11]|nr:putative esterase C31F10.02 [Yarrowia sp. C11]KAG5370503.1 putative esterase C31F10.02 [Yarrowia sp. E02]
MSHAQVLKHVRAVWGDFLQLSGLEPTLLSQLSIDSAEKGKVRLGLTVAKEHTNRLQILHGGTIASLVDLGGSMAVASSGSFATGVSTDINVSYIGSGGKIGNKIIMDCILDNMGRSLAYTSVDFYNASDLSLFARGRHTKYIKHALKDPRNVEF